MQFSASSDRLVSRPFLIVGGSIAALTAVFAVWGVFGNLRSEVEGQGLIVRGKHLVTVYSRQAGVIEKQYKQLDQLVAKGEKLLALDIADQSIQRDAAQKLKQASDPLNSRATAASNQVEILSLKTLKAAQLALEKNEETLLKLIEEQRNQYHSAKKLYESKQVSADEVASAFGGLSQLEQQLQSLRRDVVSQSIGYHQAIQSNAQNRAQIVNDQIQNDSGLSQLNLSIDQSLKIASPINGYVASYSATVGDYVNPGDPLITMMPKSGDLRAIILVSSQDFERIKVGDQALIAPSSSPSIRFGYVKGHVDALAESPATEVELIKAFGSQEIAQTLLQNFSRDGAMDLPFLVGVKLDVSSNGQPVWTLGRQPPWGLRPGSSAAARITSQEVRPISLVLPFLRGL